LGYEADMFILGLTGSVGMGKSVTARFFAEEGMPVHDADAAVHRLYEGEAVAPIEAAFPGTTANGKVDRAKLAEHVLGDAAALKRLEAIVHPLVQASERRFLAEARRAARRWPCSTFRCCSRPAAIGGSTQSWWSRHRRGCSARGCWRAPA
jgi:dephospho-CoA kinase